MWAIDKYLAHFFYYFHFYKLNNIVSLFSSLFDNDVLFFIIALALVLTKRDKHTTIKFMSLIVLSLIYVFLGKYLVHRQRPFAMLGIHNYLHLKPWASFPSGHTTFSFLLFFFVITNKYEHWISFVMFVFALLISISRIVVLAHYFSDVVISILIVLFVVVLFEYIYNKTILKKV